MRAILKWRGFVAVFPALVLAALLALAPARAEEPYARSKDYDLVNAQIHLRFDLAERKVIGETTQKLSVLRDGTRQLQFDAVDLSIESITVNGAAAKFESTPEKLNVPLASPAKRGDKFEVAIRYSARPKKGLYFILPDKDYPQRPKEIWSQGEAEDTRYYVPIYDYPNNMASSEMLLTVPADWLTISNGKLAGVKNETDGMKTWDWVEPLPHATYLISVVAGDFKEVKDSWRGMPVVYLVPNSDAEKIHPTFERTGQMLDLFSDRLGVRYPWEKYAQSAVHEFVAGGMENVSATTLTVDGLVHPQLAGETPDGSDGLVSHELAHQWFGDLLTCKDWGNLWLNEGFATYFEHLWMEQHYGQDAVDYEFWQDANQWEGSERLFVTPMVTHNLKDSLQNYGNIYTKGGWVLQMLREQLGDENFFRGLHHYLETNRGQNVVSADLSKAIEQATSINVDRFFDEWVYGAGAPRFEVHSSYDADARELNLEVKQTQKVEGRVGLFHAPVEVEITTASGRKSFPIEVGRNEETFTFPVDGPPLMVLFDKGNRILKTTTFTKSPAEWIYQLKRAATVPDRADAARALRDVKDNNDATAALGEAALHDSFWGVREQAIYSLGHGGGPAARKQIELALANEQPWVRVAAVEELGRFKGEASAAREFETIFRDDKAYSVREAALESLARVAAPNAFAILQSGVQMESPDDGNSHRRAALPGHAGRRSGRPHCARVEHAGETSRGARRRHWEPWKSG